MVMLSFDSAEIEDPVLRFNAVMAKEGTDISDTRGNASDDEVAAMFWIGRGDAGPEGWEQTKALARQQHESLVSRYLLGQPEIGEFLTEGLEKILEYGMD